MKGKGFLFIAALICFLSCSKNELNDLPSPDSDASYKMGLLNFSGYQWKIRNTGNEMSGPGGNYFSNKAAIVFVDASGDLHLNIRKKGSKWLCSEVYLNSTTGYGKYIFVTKGNVENYNEKVVAGLFTWDNFSYATDANSELDIEFSQWGDPSVTEYNWYSVQPTRGGVYPERAYHGPVPVTYDENGYSTHIFDWQPDHIHFESHMGDDTSAASLLYSFTFNNTNPPRTANEGGVLSDPVIIPVPRSDTRPHINFWLFDENGNGKGDTPTDGMNTELIIHRFEYIPM